MHIIYTHMPIIYIYIYILYIMVITNVIHFRLIHMPIFFKTINDHG